MDSDLWKLMAFTHTPQFLNAEWNRVQGLCVCVAQGEGARMCLAGLPFRGSSISLEVLSGALALALALRLPHRLIPRPAKPSCTHLPDSPLLRRKKMKSLYCQCLLPCLEV